MTAPSTFARAGIALFLTTLAACGAARTSSTGAGPAPPRPLRADTLEGNGWERDCDLVHVELDLTVDFEERSVQGLVRHKVRALVDGTSAIAVHAVGLAIESVEDGAGGALRWEADEPVVRIDLARPLARGEETVVAIRYSGRPERGLYFRDTSKDAGGPAPQVWSQGQSEDNRHWIPMWDYPNDRATFEGRFTVGEGMTAVSNGVLVGVEPADGTERTFHWRLDQRLPTYLIALAAGRWERYEDRAGDVLVEYWVGPGTGREKALRAFGETPAMLAWFEELLDEPYPYPRYAQVAVSEFLYAGMENTTVTIVDDYLIADEAEFRDLDGDPRLLVAHELAHHWFGDLLTCFGWSHLWLNEAWASYLELLWVGEVEGPAAMQLWLELYREMYLARGADTRRPLSEDWRTQLTAERCSHEYVKGPWVLYMLNRELGDEVFWQGVRHYVDRHRDGLVTTADFQRALFDATGKNVESFLEQWVEGGGHPSFRVRFDQRRARAGEGPLVLSVEQVQRTDELVPLFRTTVAVELVFADGSRRRETLAVSEREQEFELALSGPLADLVFDADAALLCALDLEKSAAMWALQARHPNAALRWRALRALGGLVRGRDGQVALAALAEALGTDSEPALRALAARASAQRSARADLALALAADPAPSVRVAAAEALAELHLSVSQRAELAALAERETSPAVRARLVWFGAPALEDAQ